MTEQSIKIKVLKCEANPYFKCGPNVKGKDSFMGVCPTNRYCNQQTWGCQGVPVKSVYRECISDRDRFCITPTNKEKTMGRI
jgi:hypothetical protein